MTEAILFTTADEFRQRSGYVADLECRSDELKDIVGGYSFAKADEVRCGLNRCHTKHQNGFVIVTKDGRETNCGHECGTREFGVPFDELRATFEVRRDAAVRASQVDGLLRSKDEMIGEARSLLAEISILAANVRSVLDTLACDQALTAAFFEAVRAGGAIRQELAVAPDVRDGMGARRRGKDFETVAQLDGIEATQTHSLLASDMQSLVVHPLESLDEAELRTLRTAAFERVVKSFDQMADTMRRARRFKAVAVQFLHKDNLAKLAELRAAIPRSRLNSKIDRALKSFEARK